MDLYELQIRNLNPEYDSLLEDLTALLYLWGKTHQIFQREHIVYREGNLYSAMIICPEIESWNDLQSTSYTIEIKDKVLQSSKSEFAFISKGKHPDYSQYTLCHSPNAIILNGSYDYSPFLDLDSYQEIPQYCINKIAAQPLDFEAINTWHRSYLALKNLWLSSEYEDFALNELQQITSVINQEGRQIAQNTAVLIQRPVYYHLFNDSHRSKTEDLSQNCPSCDQAWYWNESPFNWIHFKCDLCHLTSEESMNILDD